MEEFDKSWKELDEIIDRYKKAIIIVGLIITPFFLYPLLLPLFKKLRHH